MNNSLSAMALVVLLSSVPPCRSQSAERGIQEMAVERGAARTARPAAARGGADPAPAPRFVTVRGLQFVDPQGRQILFHGAALINKNREEYYQPRATAEDFAQMRAWGWNCIRLGMFWDGLEPEMNRFDEEYLRKLDGWIALAKAHDMHVILDMHQDLYSYKYSDGAPEWATLTDNQPHPSQTGAVWSDGYLTSPAVQRAFDNFWANKPCADGVGLQDHFAAAWQKVAAHYRNEPTVIGYDLFNEPNIGSGSLPAQEAMAVALARTLSEKDGPSVAPSPEEVVAQWITSEGRSRLILRLKEIDIYTKVVDAAGPIYVEFERARLVPMFQRVRNAIRAVDANHILFLETSMSANMGIPSGITRVVDAHGRPDALQAFAPHGYDIVVDTRDLALASNDRLALIFQRHAETGKRLDLPVLIGEWGAYGAAGPEILPTARFNAALFEEYLFSDTFWAYDRSLKDAACLEALQRPIPVRVNGTLLVCQTDFERGYARPAGLREGSPLGLSNLLEQRGAADVDGGVWQPPPTPLPGLCPAG